MGDNLKILAFAGSLRENSYNKQALKVVTDKIKQLKGNIETISLKDLNLPMYNQDDEEKQGKPQNVLEFKKMVTAADALLIASPEYNGSFSAALKNAIDWASRKADSAEGTHESFIGKPVGLIAASPGRLGGVRGILDIRQVIMNVSGVVYPNYVLVPEAHKMDEMKLEQLEKFAENFLGFIGKFAKIQ